MATTVSGIAATIDGDQILIDSVFDEDRAEFLGSLPDARWDKKTLRWRCTATPAAAWRIASRFDSSYSADVAALSERFDSSLRERRQKTTAQPEVRKTDAWRHQAEAFHFAGAGEAAMLAMKMGTGKSKVAVDLLQNSETKLALIVCPVSVMSVWPNQFRQHAAIPFHIVALNQNSSAKKRIIAEAAIKTARLKGERLVLIVNYESLWRPPFADFVLGQRWDVVILDESHRIRTHGSAVSKFCAKLSKRSERRYCLTGTPMAVPGDVFGQYRFLDPGIFGTSWHRFLHRFAKMNKAIPQKVDQWINNDELARRFALLAFEADTSVLDLPESMHERRFVTLSDEATDAYQSMEEELIAEIQAETVTAANGLVKLLRLHQLASGFIVNEVGDVVTVDHAKAEALRELLEDTDEPVVVFGLFKHDLLTIRAVAEAMGRSYGELSGSRKDGLTDRATMADVDVLGVQIQSGGVGIDLTRARIGIYLSVGFDPILYEQSLARIHRPGQDRPVVYYHILAKGTVDAAIYGALARKGDIVNRVLEYLKDGKRGDGDSF